MTWQQSDRLFHATMALGVLVVAAILFFVLRGLDADFRAPVEATDRCLAAGYGSAYKLGSKWFCLPGPAEPRIPAPEEKK
jgi:hypothetical protein